MAWRAGLMRPEGRPEDRVEMPRIFLTTFDSRFKSQLPNTPDYLCVLSAFLPQHE
jgi:hypothetical protein